MQCQQGESQPPDSWTFLLFARTPDQCLLLPVQLDTGTWGVPAASAPPQLLRDSSTPGEKQYFSTHQTRD